PALRRVLPRFLPSVREEVDQSLQMAETLGAAAIRVPGAVHGVAVTEEDVHREARSGRGAHIGPEGAVGAGIPRHAIADAVAVREELVDRPVADDHEAGVVVPLQHLEACELRGEPRAARALPLL